MIKKVSTLLILLSITIVAFAGDHFTLGVKAGYSTTLGFDKEASKDAGKSLSFDASQGFTLGFMARIGGRIFVEPELLYNYQKQSTTYNFGPVSAEGTDYKNSSIDIPLLLGYKILDVKLFKISALIGPRFRLNAGTKLGNYDNLKTNVENSSIGLDCGIGFDVLNFIIDVRYNLMPSMTSYQDITTNAKINTNATNAFEVSLAWKLW